VSSLALGLERGRGHRLSRRSLEFRRFEAKWFYGVYAACAVSAAALVWFPPDVVWLNIAAQVLNVFLLPLVIGLLVALAATAPPEPMCGCRLHLLILIVISASVIAVGLYGGVSGLL
jgi:hypothetical protein